jgi:heptosyltransferase-2
LSSQKSIVFIQTAFIGDLFLSLPTLQQIRSTYPEHKIILVCKKGLSEYFIKENKVDVAFEIEKGKSNSYADAILKINQHLVDVVICPHRSFRSAWLAFQIKSPVKVGFSRIWARLFFNKTVTYQKKWPDVIRQMNILSVLSATVQKEIEIKDWSFLNFCDSHGAFPQIPSFFQFPKTQNKSQKNNLTAIFPGSVWKTKQWTVEGFTEVVTALLKNGQRVLLMGGPTEKEICDQIQKVNPQAENWAGRLSLYESILKIKECQQVLCNDSAPAHMAASLGIPVVSIFGPTTLELGFRPWNDQSCVVENLQIDCRPCGAHGHNQCPKGHHRCMKDLSSENVIQKMSFKN